MSFHLCVKEYLVRVHRVHFLAGEHLKKIQTYYIPGVRTYYRQLLGYKHPLPPDVMLYYKRVCFKTLIYLWEYERYALQYEKYLKDLGEYKNTIFCFYKAYVGPIENTF